MTFKCESLSTVTLLRQEKKCKKNDQAHFKYWELSSTE